jgi:hydrogenase maturation protein HypF
VQGAQSSLASFLKHLEDDAPPLAEVKQIATQSLALLRDEFERFSIVESISGASPEPQFVPPDAATCNQCLSELFDQTNRRYRYPFINCTNCGPRFTIISSLPYDRASTTMNPFTMCESCQSEYDNPSDRRFHAQPNACWDCGPHLTYLTDRKSKTLDEDALAFSLAQILQGKIIAVKGLGGFQLICDATNKLAIERLRLRKRRNAKPFALMMTNLAMVENYCRVSAEEVEELKSVRRPVVLLEKLPGCNLPDNIAPGINCWGVMLPYTPLHHLLLSDYGKPLIATSGNLSEEPIAMDNEEALERLSGIADGFLLHDRAIYSRYDDSVVRLIDKKFTVLRRARGMAPRPILLPFKSKLNVVATGGHLKNTFCLVRDDQAFVSQHIGDLENLETHNHFEQTFNTYKELFAFEPEIVAHDAHPDYLSTTLAKRLAQEHKIPAFGIQHHHAHIVSCMVEHGISQPVIGVALDGHGYGQDATLWGGEVLLTSFKDYQRLAHLALVPLPGGIQAIRQPWRMALSYIFAETCAREDLFGPYVQGLYMRYGRSAVETVRGLMQTRVNAPLTSSCGRLFDAMSALLNVCDQNDYEGQAAIELESLANAAQYVPCGDSVIYPCGILDDRMPMTIKTRDILLAAYQDYRGGRAREIVAARFHHAVARMILSVCEKASCTTGIKTICLGGGVFQNALLLRLVESLLNAGGFRVFFPQQLPANDGGISLGQAVVSLAQADAIPLMN